MATSQGVNVLRYSALAAGLFYGAYHQYSLNSQAKATAIDREYHRKESLIAQAKAEYAKKNAPQESKPASSGLITDPDDKRFDLEKFLLAKAAETTK